MKRIKEEEVIKKLSPILQDTLKLETYEKYLKDIPIISNIFSREVIKEITKIIKEVWYCKNDVIYYEG